MIDIGKKSYRVEVVNIRTCRTLRVIQKDIGTRKKAERIFNGPGPRVHSTLARDRSTKF